MNAQRPMTPTSTIQHPRPGMLATIRNRRGLIATVEPFDSQEGRLHLVRVEYTDSDGVAEDTVLWEEGFIHLTVIETVLFVQRFLSAG